MAEEAGEREFVSGVSSLIRRDDTGNSTGTAALGWPSEPDPAASRRPIRGSPCIPEQGNPVGEQGFSRWEAKLREMRRLGALPRSGLRAAPESSDCPAWAHSPRVRRAHRKLLLVHAAEGVDDLRIPPGNRLERLKGDRAGQHSIRINDQRRICFLWAGGDAHDVEITDCH